LPKTLLRMKKILAVADAVSPFVYSERFPKNLPEFDIVLSAGDMPGHVLEFMATKLGKQPIYVVGNHNNEYLRSSDRLHGDEKHLPGGCINAHARCVNVEGTLIIGIEGCGRYRPGPHQYTERQMAWMLNKLTPQLLWNKQRYGRAVDVLLTHAAPNGPHEGEDFPHRGIPAFNTFHKRWKPKVHVHGHVHLQGANAKREYESPEGVRVINAFEHTIIEL